MITPARPLRKIVLSATVLSAPVSRGTWVAMTAPAPGLLLLLPLNNRKLASIRFWGPPAVLCPATMTPLPPGLRLASFAVKAWNLLRPMASVTRKPPPALYLAVLWSAAEKLVPLKSTPTSPLRRRILPRTRTLVLLATRIASNPAFTTVKPAPRTWRVASTTTPLPPGTGSPGAGFWPVASITAPRRPSRLSGFLITTWVRYVPRHTTTVPPALTAPMALLILETEADCH